MKKELIVKKEIRINASSTFVWDALTNPGLKKKYMYNSEVISDWKEGSSIIWKDADSGKVHVRGIIKGIIPGHFLSTLDFSLDSGLPDVKSFYSRVTYELTNENGCTLLKITEENFNRDQKRYDDSDKFWDSVLKGLRDLLEK